MKQHLLKQLLLLLFMFTATVFAGPVSYHGQLTVDGNRIKNADKSRNVQIKGPSLYWSTLAGAPHYSQKTVDWFVDNMDISVIRAAMAIKYWDNNSVSPIYDGLGNFGYLSTEEPDAKEKQKALIHTVVEAAILNDIYVIIDWHSHAAHTETTEAVAFFTEMATIYKGVPNVIFEIYHEPTDEVTWSQVYNYAKQVIAAIRGTGNTNLILVGSPSWSSYPSQGSTSDLHTAYANIAYTMHFYADTHFTGGTQYSNSNTAMSNGAAVFVSEWGTVNANGSGSPNTGSTNQWTSWMDANNISSCNWAAVNLDESAAMWASGSENTITNLSASGQLFYNYMGSKTTPPTGYPWGRSQSLTMVEGQSKTFSTELELSAGAVISSVAVADGEGSVSFTDGTITYTAPGTATDSVISFNYVLSQGDKTSKHRITVNMVPADKITFTWQGRASSKSINLQATTGTGNVKIDWGNGTVTTHNGRGTNNINTPATSITYGDTATYTVSITALDENTDLTYFYVYNQQVSALDVSQAPALTYLYCNKNRLDTLDVSVNTALTELNCGDNRLTALDVSTNTTLTNLYCETNLLDTLDISANKALLRFNCSNNLLDALDLSQNTALTYLSCNNNQLTTLDMRQNTALTDLYCHSNQLTTLDMRQNTALNTLSCYNNQLTTLDMRQNTALNYLYCYNNQLPLSQLRTMWLGKTVKKARDLDPQAIYDTVVAGQNIDLSAELAFGTEPDIAQTQFVITMEDDASAEGKYSFEDGLLVFSEAGSYKVVMTNDSVRSGTSAQGDALTVTTHYEVNPITPVPSEGILYVRQDGNGNGNSWEEAYGDLATALRYAYMNPGTVKEIYVAGGTYSPKYNPADYGLSVTYSSGSVLAGDKTFLLPPNVKIYGGFDAVSPEAKPDDRKWLAEYRENIADFGASDVLGSATILTGALEGEGKDTAFHVVMLVDTNKVVKNEYHLDGFKITNGRGKPNRFLTIHAKEHYRNNGAGVYVYTSDSISLNFQNNRITGNTSVVSDQLRSWTETLAAQGRSGNHGIDLDAEEAYGDIDGIAANADKVDVIFGVEGQSLAYLATPKGAGTGYASILAASGGYTGKIYGPYDGPSGREPQTIADLPFDIRDSADNISAYYDTYYVVTTDQYNPYTKAGLFLIRVDGQFLSSGATTTTPVTIWHAASSSGGGGVYVRNGKHTILYNSIDENSAFVGGGIYIESGNHTISYNRISENTSNSGAGIYAAAANNTLLNQNIIFSNSAVSASGVTRGGGIYSDAGKLLNNTFYNNYAQGNTQANTQGQEVYSEGSSKIYNNIIYNAKADTALYVAAGTALIKNNLLSDTALIGDNKPVVTDGNAANNLFTTDPLFTGADVGNFSLSLFSPAINAGDTALFRQVMGFDAKDTVDAAGNPRLVGKQLDMGVYENQTVLADSLALSPNTLRLNIDNSQTLTATVFPANATNKNVNWLSRNEAVVTVSATGEVTAIAAGTAFVVATTEDGGFTDSCRVYVPSNNANLASLSVSEGELAPAFNKDSLSYTVEVAYEVNSISISAKAAHDSASVQGTGEKSLSVGSNPFNVVVTAESDSTKTYTVTVVRAAYVPSSNADLATLSVSSGTLAPAFNKDSLSYAVEVAYEVNSISISAKAAHDSASVQGTGEKSLSVGSNPFNVVVTAESDSTKTYTVTVVRVAYVPSSNADLATLSVSSGTLAPAFHKDSLTYRVEVPYEIDSVVLSAAAEASGATVEGIGKKALEVGENPSLILVVAEDTTVRKAYAVTIIRSADTKVEGIVEHAMIKVYPNPVSKGEELKIELPLDKTVEVSLYDTLGKLIFTQRLSGKQEISVPDKPGLYFLKMDQQTIKVVVY